MSGNKTIKLWDELTWEDTINAVNQALESHGLVFNITNESEESGYDTYEYTLQDTK
jgi:hypothetical protein